MQPELVDVPGFLRDSKSYHFTSKLGRVNATEQNTSGLRRDIVEIETVRTRLDIASTVQSIRDCGGGLKVMGKRVSICLISEQLDVGEGV